MVTPRITIGSVVRLKKAVPGRDLLETKVCRFITPDVVLLDRPLFMRGRYYRCWNLEDLEVVPGPEVRH